MSVDTHGPVTLGEVQQVVTDLNTLLARAMEHHQHAYGMVLHMAAESLGDNIEQAEEWASDEA